MENKAPTAEVTITEILYKNSTDCSEGLIISFERIQEVVKLLTNDKIEHSKFHVEAALKSAAENVDMNEDYYFSMQEGSNGWVDKETILNAYPISNIK